MDTYLVVLETSSNEVKSKISRIVSTFPNSIQIMDSVWGIVTNKSIQQIHDILIEPISGDEKLLIVRTGFYSSWQNLDSAVSHWVKNFI